VRKIGHLWTLVAADYDKGHDNGNSAFMTESDDPTKQGTGLAALAKGADTSQKPNLYVPFGFSLPPPQIKPPWWSDWLPPVFLFGSDRAQHDAAARAGERAALTKILPLLARLFAKRKGQPRTKRKRDLASQAAKELWPPDGIPPQQLTDDGVHGEIIAHLRKQRVADKNLPGRDTSLRATGRRIT
jgi:hypothetical protein